MRKCHLMDGLRIQLQHKEGIVAPLREEGGGGEKGMLELAAGWLEQ